MSSKSILNFTYIAKYLPNCSALLLWNCGPAIGLFWNRRARCMLVKLWYKQPHIRHDELKILYWSLTTNVKFNRIFLSNNNFYPLAPDLLIQKAMGALAAAAHCGFGIPVFSIKGGSSEYEGYCHRGYFKPQYTMPARYRVQLILINSHPRSSGLTPIVLLKKSNRLKILYWNFKHAKICENNMNFYFWTVMRSQMTKSHNYLRTFIKTVQLKILGEWFIMKLELQKAR